MAGCSWWVAVDGDENDVTAELYDPESGTWSATGSMLKPHACGFRATLLRDGRVLVGEDDEPETDRGRRHRRGGV